MFLVDYTKKVAHVQRGLKIFYLKRCTKQNHFWRGDVHTYPGLQNILVYIFRREMAGVLAKSIFSPSVFGKIDDLQTQFFLQPHRLAKNMRSLLNFGQNWLN